VSSVLSLPTPLRLAPNYTWRSYRGGSRLREFRGEPGTADDHFPEDWLASSVRARNGANTQGVDEGLSRVEWNGRERLLSDLPFEAPEYFSQQGDFNVLLKLLDSAERLHIQAHPDNNFVRQRFGTPYGKTECWYVLSTRGEDAHVLLGFQNPPAPNDWKKMMLEQNIDGMLACFDRIPVKTGDCLMVPAGVPHAIGEGVFILELQQPSDWVVRCEFTVGDHTLPPEARFMGLELEECFEIFDFRRHAPNAFLQIPRVINQSDTHLEEQIIDTAYEEFFRLRRLRGTGNAQFFSHGPAVMVLTQGEGSLHGGDHVIPVQRGETLLLPAAPQPLNWHSHGSWEYLIAHPPKL